jgi:hypothetical protein
MAASCRPRPIWKSPPRSPHGRCRSPARHRDRQGNRQRHMGNQRTDCASTVLRKPLRQSRFGAPPRYDSLGGSWRCWRASSAPSACRQDRGLCALAWRRREALDAPCSRAGGNTGGAIGREALDAATVVSGAGIKPGEPGAGAIAGRSIRRRAAPLDGAVPLRRNRCQWCDRPRLSLRNPMGEAANGGLDSRAFGCLDLAESPRPQSRVATMAASLTRLARSANRSACSPTLTSGACRRCRRKAAND